MFQPIGSNMKKVKLFINQNEQSLKTARRLLKLLGKRGFIEVEQNYEIAISVGGDGAFLRMVKETNFNPDIYYIGVHTGTLGFLPEVLPNELEEFVSYLTLEEYKVDEIGLLETTIECEKEVKRLISLNEIVIRDFELGSLTLDIKLENWLLERFKGDGMLISTSIGSTAYNLSFGGSIVYFYLHTLQLTPIAPFNSSSYRNLQNSVVLPENITIEINPVNNDHLWISADGENYNIQNVKRIIAKIGNQKMKRLRYHNLPFPTIIKEKFLK